MWKFIVTASGEFTFYRITNYLTDCGTSLIFVCWPERQVDEVFDENYFYEKSSLRPNDNNKSSGFRARRSPTGSSTFDWDGLIDGWERSETCWVTPRKPKLYKNLKFFATFQSGSVAVRGARLNHFTAQLSGSFSQLEWLNHALIFIPFSHFPRIFHFCELFKLFHLMFLLLHEIPPIFTLISNWYHCGWSATLRFSWRTYFYALRLEVLTKIVNLKE